LGASKREDLPASEKVFGHPTILKLISVGFVRKNVDKQLSLRLYKDVKRKSEQRLRHINQAKERTQKSQFLD
jgi:hypothetical protein